MDTAKLQRISEKLDACQILLGHMVDSRSEWLKFGIYLSAFLSAYREIFWRLIRTAKGTPCELQIEDSVEQFYRDNPTVGFLKNARDIETHEFGIEYFRNFAFSMSYLPKSRFAPHPSDTTDIAYSRYPAVREFHEFLAFKGHPQEDMIEFCAAGLDQAREFVYQTLRAISETAAA
jgi:hypothetical protein